MIKSLKIDTDTLKVKNSNKNEISRLRYDKNFHTSAVRSFPKYYGQELEAKIERAIQPKHNPVLVKVRGLSTKKLLQSGEKLRFLRETPL